MITAVGQAATVPPRIVILEYNGGQPNDKYIALVGKGITFDSGGLNIKTSGMEDMHLDMGGAAAVLGSIKAIAQLKVPKNVVRVSPPNFTCLF
jgi:leucyl aminopeptidase